MTTGEKLTLLRQRKKMTQAELVKDFNKKNPDLIPVKRATYAHWESDNRTLQLDHFKGMVIYHQVSADELLFDNRIPEKIRTQTRTRKSSFTVA